MNEFLRQTAAIARKDLRVELRNKEVTNAALSFALVVLLLFSFAFDPISNPDTRSMAGGLLWIVYSFAGILVLNRSFARETANDCLSALVAAPVSGSAIFTGKLVANGVMILILEVVTLIPFGVFYDVRWTDRFPQLFAVLVLGTLSFTIVGVVFGAVTANNRLRELMLPLLVFPIALPALMACVELTRVIFAGEPIGDAFVWFKLLISFDVVFALLGASLLDYVLAA
ncbi:MAG: heme exporter protein CcmB [Acidobacteria bacterium]|nr:heme exporter protein CcmB [Acidobacteriota bacterium]